MRHMLADLWPLYGLELTTPRLRLRLPREEELADLADLAGRGVHRPGERPFLTRWTEGTPLDRARHVLREHWEQLAEWDVNDWQLGLAVFHADRPIGIVTVSAHDFPVVREVKTWSWLGLEHQRQGFGTEGRAALLTFAFDHLAATAAITGAFQDNHASLGVSRKLGYQPDGISVDACDGEAVVSQWLRLTRERWLARDRPKVTVDGLDDSTIQMFTPSG
jgi:RimJ/RimL family protein N-acetyltransferase